MKKDIHVAVCVPSTGFWRSDMAKSLVLMTSYYHLHKVPGAREQTMALLSADGSMLSTLREVMTRKVLQNHYTHILWIDSDMEFPMNALNGLLAHNKNFVASNCTTRKFPIEPTAHDMNGEQLDSRGQKGLQQVQHVGLAFALIKTSVIKGLLKPPLYLMDWIPTLNAYCGEDVYLCQKLAEANCKMYIDHDLSQKILHIGTYNYGFKDLGKTNGQLG